jgi:hypothetical protein
VRITILHRPAADLGAIELEGVQTQGLRGGEAIRARRQASQTLFEEVSNRLGPGRGVVTPRDSRGPQTLFLSSAGAQVIGQEGIDAAAGQTELFGGSVGAQGSLS